MALLNISRFCRIGSLTCRAFAACLALCFLASIWFDAGLTTTSGHYSRVIGGRLLVGRDDPPAAPHLTLARHHDRLRWETRLVGTADRYELRLPLYIPFGAAALLAFLSSWCSRRTNARPHLPLPTPPSQTPIDLTPPAAP